MLGVSECLTRAGGKRVKLPSSMISGERRASFDELEAIIDANACETIDSAGGPANFQLIDTPGFAEPEMNAQIVLRIEATSAADLIHLPMSCGHARDARSDRAAVGLGSDQLQGDPVI